MQTSNGYIPVGADGEIDQRALQQAKATAKLLREIRQDNADAGRQERNEARRFHQWCRAHLTGAAVDTLEALERRAPWILEPEEPLVRSVPL